MVADSSAKWFGCVDIFLNEKRLDQNKCNSSRVLTCFLHCGMCLVDRFLFCGRHIFWQLILFLSDLILFLLYLFIWQQFFCSCIHPSLKLDVSTSGLFNQAVFFII